MQLKIKIATPLLVVATQWENSSFYFVFSFVVVVFCFTFVSKTTASYCSCRFPLMISNSFVQYIRLILVHCPMRIAAMENAGNGGAAVI